MKNVILIGYMGAGKTTVGEAYAAQTGRTLVDTDELIVKAQGKSINAIFAEDGEPAFRQMETDTIRGLLGTQDLVISVGGGLPMKEENHAILKELGCVVYLKIRPETVAERLVADTTRPLLAGADIRAKAEQMLAIRGPVYEKIADLAITVDGKTTEEILGELTAFFLD